MVKFDFGFTRTPQIIFGIGKFNLLAEITRQYGSTMLIVTGSSSLQNSGKADWLNQELGKCQVKFYYESITSEPSPQIVDRVVKKYQESSIDVVLSIGGGSVVDAGKAVSAMLGKKESVVNYLEDVGHKDHDGSKVPFIAVPTTAGTGSEATKNAVLSVVGSQGYKKSLRHDNFVPDIALIDPELTVSCPANVTAACGMDAFTQLLESYVSSKASPLTDALAYSGIEALKDNLIPIILSSGQNLQMRSAMSYASLLSGITLANAGLGIVHGLASSIGGFYDIPHGVVCGTLIGIATQINIERLMVDKKENHSQLKKYADIGRLLSNDGCETTEKCCTALVRKIEEWTEKLKLPRLANYGITPASVEKIVADTSNKNNPVKLNKNDIRKIILNRI
jgi:alcohol dehydrogenase